MIKNNFYKKEVLLCNLNFNSHIVGGRKNQDKWNVKLDIQT